LAPAPPPSPPAGGNRRFREPTPLPSGVVDDLRVDPRVSHQVGLGTDLTLGKGHSLGAQFLGNYADERLRFSQGMSNRIKWSNLYATLFHTFRASRWSLQTTAEGSRGSSDLRRDQGAMDVATKDDNRFARIALDFAHRLSSIFTLYAGAEVSRVAVDSRLTSRADELTLREWNIEGYTQYTHTLGKLELSAGLRMEYMHTSSKLNAYSSQDGEEHSGSHLRLFPNLSISYALNEQSKVALLYSRRQDKPRYEDLNPFEYLLDELSYWKGNPFLKPQISNKLILSYVWNSLSLNLSYSKLDDYFTSITDALGTTKTIMTTKNIGAQQQVGLEGLFSKRLTPWWDFSANLGLYYFVNKLDYETYKEEYKRPSYLMSVSNSILLPLGLNLELSGRYHSKRQGGSYEVIKPNGSLDIGLSRMWADDRLRLSLLMTDIFHTDRWDNYGHKGALDLTTWFGSESRKVILRLSYSLGKQKFNKVESSLGELDRL